MWFHSLIVHRASALTSRKEGPSLQWLWPGPAELLPPTAEAALPKSHTNTGAPLETRVFGTCSWNGKEKLTTLLIMPLQKEAEPDKCARKDDPDPLTGQFCRKFSTVSSNTPFQAGSSCHLSRQGPAGLAVGSDLRPCRFPEPKYTMSQPHSNSHTQLGPALRPCCCRMGTQHPGGEEPSAGGCDTSCENSNKACIFFAFLTSHLHLSILFSFCPDTSHFAWHRHIWCYTPLFFFH